MDIIVTPEIYSKEELPVPLPLEAQMNKFFGDMWITNCIKSII